MTRRRRRRGRDIDGIVLLDKPAGVSSNKALQRVKRAFNANKAGHTGNLDNLASGLLPICLGNATKVCQFLLDADKHYAADFTFGRRTSTGDSAGEVIEQGDASQMSAARVARECERFEGPQQQIPPMFSALKRDGQPLYKLAYQGIEIAREPREIHIETFRLVAFECPRGTFDIRCSKGTYVRTLAEDLGAALGCGAHVSRLRRVGAGPFEIALAVSLDEVERLADEGQQAALDALLLGADQALTHLGEATLDEDAAYYLLHGQPVLVPRAPTVGLLRLYDSGGTFLGIGEVQRDGRIAPRRLMKSAAAENPVKTVAEGS